MFFRHAPARVPTRQARVPAPRDSYDVLFSQQHVYHVPEYVQQRCVYFLYAVDTERGHRETVLGDFLGPAAVLSREGDRQHAEFAGRLEPIVHIWRHPAGRDSEDNIARLAEQLELLGKGL